MLTEADEAVGEGGMIKVELAMIEEVAATASDGPTLCGDGAIKSTPSSACAMEGVRALDAPAICATGDLGFCVGSSPPSSELVSSFSDSTLLSSG